MTYAISVTASMMLSGVGKSENRLAEQVAGGNALPRAPQGALISGVEMLRR